MFYKSMVMICLSLMLTLCVSCDDDDDPVSSQDIAGSGVMDTEERNVGAFHSVELSTVGNVHLTYGMTQSVSITVDDNIMDYITTSVSGGWLTISSPANVTLRDFELSVDITMTDFEGLDLKGVGNFISMNLLAADTAEIVLSGVGNMFLEIDTDYLTTIHSGVGNFNLIGNTETHSLNLSGIGDIAAFEFVTDTTIALLGGVGNAQVYAEDYLDVIIGGTGSLFYKGDPTITQVITGSGQVIDAN